MVIYLVAKADVNGDYLDSLSGITNEVEIPNRLKAPNIAWAKSWEYTRDNPTRAEDFRNTDDGAQWPGDHGYGTG